MFTPAAACGTHVALLAAPPRPEDYETIPCNDLRSSYIRGGYGAGSGADLGVAARTETND